MFLKTLAGVAGAFMRGFKRLTGLGEENEPDPSRRDLTRSVDDIAIKRILGRSFFTRRLNPMTRQRRINNLRPEQRARARELRWID